MATMTTLTNYNKDIMTMTCSKAASRQLQQSNAMRQSNKHNAITRTMQEQEQQHNNDNMMAQQQ